MKNFMHTKVKRISYHSKNARMVKNFHDFSKCYGNLNNDHVVYKKPSCILKMFNIYLFENWEKGKT